MVQDVVFTYQIWHCHLYICSSLMLCKGEKVTNEEVVST